jgi:aspartate/methionine/tyrosine aminotransferase
LLEQGVVVMAGSSLGGAGRGYIRFALTQSPDRLAEAATRVSALI